MKNKTLVVFVAFLLTFAVSNLFGQSYQQIKNKINQNNLSDEDIQKMIEESGLSQEELIEKAREAGYSQNEIDIMMQAADEKDKSVKSSMEKDNQTQITPPSTARPDSFTVDEFAQREDGIDLEAFGYRIFNYPVNTFEPSSNIPVPSSYVVGPGDEIVISLWGETQLVHSLTVSKNGDIYIPNVGLVDVNGLTIRDLKAKLYNVLSKVYASLGPDDVDAKTKLDVTTGKLRSVKVYVLGEVNTPGGYTLPAMSTCFTALYYSGGPKINGSLRKVQVMRGGEKIGELDLYDYLVSGSKTSDIRLEDEDVIYVPPIGKRVALKGNVFRPAIYELKEKETLADLLKYTGGLKFTAYFERIHIERVIPFAQRKLYSKNILSIDLSFQTVNELENSNYELEDGDLVSISEINQLPENRVEITGYVKKPGVYELPPSEFRIRDLILEADSLLDEAFTGKGLLIRTLPSEKKQVFNFNVHLALEGDPGNNLLLKNRDEVEIFDSKSFFPERTVEISGSVKEPGFYTRLENMTLSELIIMAGGLTEQATTEKIEIARMDSTNPTLYAEKYLYTLPKDYWKIPKSDDFYLRDFDKVLIKPDPNKTFTGNIAVGGEVLNPGRYAILYEGERLTSFLERAGGFKSTAYKNGIYVFRKNNLFQESNINDMRDSLLTNNKVSVVYDRSIVSKYSNMIPIEWDEIVKDTNSIYNLRLEPGDSLIVPQDSHVITIIGDVSVPSYVPYKEGAGLDYYINQSGGYTQTSQKGDEIVIGPNGKKWEGSGFFLIPDPEIPSGTTIIVPTKIEHESEVWPFVKDVVTVLSSTAIVILTVINLTD